MERGYEGSTASTKLHENKIARIGRRWKTQPLQLPPNVLEIEKAFFPFNPLGCPHCTFREAASGLGVMAEIDCVVSGIKHHFVHADHFSFAEGRDLNFQIRILLQQILNSYGRA